MYLVFLEIFWKYQILIEPKAVNSGYGTMDHERWNSQVTGLYNAVADSIYSGHSYWNQRYDWFWFFKLILWLRLENLADSQKYALKAIWKMM